MSLDEKVVEGLRGVSLGIWVGFVPGMEEFDNVQ
jgi:hypothetical protein